MLLKNAESSRIFCNFLSALEFYRTLREYPRICNIILEYSLIFLKNIESFENA